MGSRRAAWRAGQTPNTTPTARLNRTAATTVVGVEGEAPAGELADAGRHEQADGDADEAAEQRQGQGLDEELGEDVPAARADGLADADLAGPLADRDQHDVHDPDAADDERDRGDPAEQQGQRAADRRGGLEQLGLVEDAEVVVVGGRQLVAVAQERGDLGVGRRPCRRRRRRSRRWSARCRRRRSTSARSPTGTMTWSSGSWKPVPPLGWRMPMTVNGMPPMRDLGAEVVGVEAEVLGGRGPEDGDAQAALDGDVGQERALPDVEGADRRHRPRSCRRWSSSVDSSPAVDGLARRDLRGDAGDAVELGDRLGVLERQARRPVARLRRRADRQQVRAQAARAGR